jgi:hypothetical protein
MAPGGNQDACPADDCPVRAQATQSVRRLAWFRLALMPGLLEQDW